MRAIALAPVRNMPISRVDDFGELGFTQNDRDELKQGTWLLKDIREKLDAFDKRLERLENGRAHQKDLDALTTKWEKGHAALTDEVQKVVVKLATVGGVGMALAFLEPVLMHMFWK